ncbi:MAG: RNA polymerase subunit sigma-70 [Acidobacteria bacterium]|nr:MAG: RNA polymerase subunit sigma-70 [Acidobacteriota bacterium]REK02814.1 MAG: RNA polymerase subunit sigma-70 [Acidobacteriota bacterium]REK13382.1 MAG: RNA polymerase subunit sigma-70 [Acidobacteriota bacterium]REK41376.1 MAG: RNA polymerase subunit sigma-70 [Acidobacteriota bacterium]
MSSEPQEEITQLLVAWGQGDKDALDKLMPYVYSELRRLAHAYMRRQRSDHTLQTTALVNEAYMRLIDSSRIRWQDRNHFFAMSARLMRRILVDFARAKNAQKRGGGDHKVTFDEEMPVAERKEADLLALDEALSRLTELDDRQGRIVELKYFGGLTEDEIAEVLEVSSRTVRRDWSVARAWLFRELKQD